MVTRDALWSSALTHSHPTRLRVCYLNNKVRSMSTRYVPLPQYCSAIPDVDNLSSKFEHCTVCNLQFDLTVGTRDRRMEEWRGVMHNALAFYCTLNTHYRIVYDRIRRVDSKTKQFKLNLRASASCSDWPSSGH